MTLLLLNNGELLYTKVHRSAFEQEKIALSECLFVWSASKAHFALCVQKYAQDV